MMTPESYETWLASVPAEIIRLVLAMVPQQRGGLIREKRTSYRSRTNQGQPGLTPNREELESLLQHIPYPD